MLIKILFLLSIYLPVEAAPTYSNNDVQQFEQTNSCIKCDLTDFDMSQLSNHNYAILEGARLMHSKFFANKFNQSNFFGAYFTKSSSNRSNFRSNNFTSAHLNSVYFVESELSGSKFINADLKNANFTRSNLSNVDFTDANLEGADFTRAILIGSNLTSEQISKIKSLKCAVLPNGEVNIPENDKTCSYSIKMPSKRTGDDQ